MSEKTCTACGIKQPFTSFYKGSGILGLRSKCKTCCIARVLENREVKLRENANYGKQPGGHQTPEKQRKYRQENRKKCNVHKRVDRAITAGKLKPQPCDECGNLKVHAHHDDYDKPLTVRWLCSKHHTLWHLIHGEGANAR